MLRGGAFICAQRFWLAVVLGAEKLEGDDWFSRRLRALYLYVVERSVEKFPTERFPI